VSATGHLGDIDMLIFNVCYGAAGFADLEKDLDAASRGGQKLRHYYLLVESNAMSNHKIPTEGNFLHALGPGETSKTPKRGFWIALVVADRS
jgi:hypothetical protein